MRSWVDLVKTPEAGGIVQIHKCHLLVLFPSVNYLASLVDLRL